MAMLLILGKALLLTCILIWLDMVNDCACMHGRNMVLFLCMHFICVYVHYILWFCLCLNGHVYAIQLQLKLNKTQTNILIYINAWLMFAY